MALLSTTKTSKLLVDLKIVDAPFTTRDLRAGRVKGVCDETYGRDSRLYVRVADMAERHRVEAAITRAGGRVHRNYSPGKPVVETQVSYFKGWHWNE